MSRPHFIQQILKTKLIVSYLESHGHDPVSQNNYRLNYLCPLHGPEKSASFYVFINDEFQYYHCFGCSDHGDIINLVSKLEKITIKQAIVKLAKGLNIDVTDELDQIIKDMSQNNVGLIRSIDEISYQLSRTCFAFLEQVKFDQYEVIFMDKVFEKVDKIIHALDLQTLEKVYDIISGPGIQKRKELYMNRIEKEMSDKFVKNED